MPVSRNRKQHAKKLQQRKEQIIFRKRQLGKLYAEMYKELSNKSESMVEMLNKEDNSQAGYSNSFTPEEQLNQDKLQETAISTASEA